MKGKGKKGVTLQHTIITLVLLLVAAAVIFLIFFRIPYGELINEETCRSSVILRGSILGTAGEFVPGASPPPLRCKTKQLEVKTTDENEIKRIMANEMYSCWDMLGRGRINFLKKSTSNFAVEEFAITEPKSACVICTVIQFNENLKKNPKNINLVEYLEKNNPPLKNITYLEFFSEEEGARLPVGADITALIKTDKDYAILFFEFDSVGVGEVMLKDLGAAASVFFVGSLIPGGKLVGRAAGRGVGAIARTPYGLAALIATSVAALGYQTYTAYKGQLIAAAYCDGERSGCSQVMLVDYDIKSINQLCDTMQSIP